MRNRTLSTVLAAVLTISCGEGPTFPQSPDVTGQWSGANGLAEVNVRLSYGVEQRTCSDFCSSGGVQVVRLTGTVKNLTTGESVQVSSSTPRPGLSGFLSFKVFPRESILIDTVASGGTGTTWLAGHVVDGTTLNVAIVTRYGTNRLATGLGDSTAVVLRRQ